MRAIRAKELIIIPGEPPIQDGAVIFHDGRVQEAGPAKAVLRGFDGPVENLGDVTVVPGLINAHVHLELSHAAGATVRGQGFAAWVRSLLATPMNDLPPAALGDAIQQLAACGTAAVIDITGRNTPQVAAALTDASIGGALAVEFFGFADAGAMAWPPSLDELPTPDWKRVAAAGHALYSTHHDTLRAAKRWSAERGRVYSIHLAEHPDETEQMLTGGSEFADLLRGAGILPADWTPPGCGPVEYADRLGLLDERTLAVHCVQVDDSDIALLAGRGASVCLCPRSNDYIGVGRAPWEKNSRAGINLCLGTDGLSSNDDLNLWNEAAAILENSQSPPAFDEILRWMTVNPARVLGADNLYGTLEPGKVAGYSIVPSGGIRSA